MTWKPVCWQKKTADGIISPIQSVIPVKPSVCPCRWGTRHTPRTICFHFFQHALRGREPQDTVAAVTYRRKWRLRHPAGHRSNRHHRNGNNQTSAMMEGMMMPTWKTSPSSTVEMNCLNDDTYEMDPKISIVFAGGDNYRITLCIIDYQ